jgi:hypothetical protein
MDKVFKKRIQEEKKKYGREVPEDNRKVIVAKRREGKTQKLIDISYEKIEKGEDVLFVSHHSGIQRFTIDMFKETNGMHYFGGEYNARERRIKFNTGGSITFKTLEEIKSRGFMSQSYKDHYSILDNAALNGYGFDLITINGELYDE